MGWKGQVLSMLGLMLPLRFPLLLPRLGVLVPECPSRSSAVALTGACVVQSESRGRRVTAGWLESRRPSPLFCGVGLRWRSILPRRRRVCHGGPWMCPLARVSRVSPRW